MATGGSYEVDKKTGEKTLKERTQDDHADGLASSPTEKVTEPVEVKKNGGEK